ncbi:MAG: alpha/beta hydrolase family protein [Alistipes sp.]
MPSEDLIRRFSTERHIVAATEHTPATSPCFIALSSDDEVVPTRNSTMFYDSLCSKGVPAELHVYPTGRHGWIGDFVYWDEYHASLSRWLKQLRKKAAAADTACPKLSR